MLPTRIRMCMIGSSEKTDNMISPYSYKIVGATTAVFVLLCVLNIFFSNTLFLIINVLVGIVFLFNFYFFRDPERKIPDNKNAIVSPADGTVIKIEEVDEPLYFKGRAQMVSIFMSVVSVHVNRIPISGKVDYLDYQVGKFLAAFDHKASDENEQSIIGISSGTKRVLFKQIAGIVARRIVYKIVQDQEVSAGERFGLIHYGSRVDMFFALDVDVKVMMKQKVTSGETIIGEFK